MKNSEKQFFASLRWVIVHLIKHDEKLYKRLLPFFASYDENKWPFYDVEEKRKLIRQLRSTLNGQDEISKYFQAYPHQWSKKRFEEFKSHLEKYEAELAS